MKRGIAVIVATGFVAYATVALATPGSGSVATILSSGSLQVDLPYNTGLPIGSGLTWGKQYSPDQLPEFLMMLRRNGVEDLGQWLQTHPAVESKLGLAPIAILKTPVVVTQQIKYPPGSFSGWHSHPGYLTATVIS